MLKKNETTAPAFKPFLFKTIKIYAIPHIAINVKMKLPKIELIGGAPSGKVTPIAFAHISPNNFGLYQIKPKIRLAIDAAKTAKQIIYHNVGIHWNCGAKRSNFRCNDYCYNRIRSWFASLSQSILIR